MGLSARQVRIHVIRPTLQQLALWSPAAENLVCGTAAHESGGFRYIDQVTGPDDERLGPAFGLYQIEPATHDDLVETFVKWRPAIASGLEALAALAPSRHRQLATNLCYATAICRLIYYRRPEALPAADDLPGLAAFWKRFYNTALGKGTEAQFILHYNAYCK